MSNPGGGSNWTTNVNRSKTKRWVEAKSYSYDGDDWGDVDEYGEYDDEPKEEAPKPAGLRKVTAPAAVSSPMQSPAENRGRANSFGQDEERRAFSGPTRTAYAQPQPSRAQPAPTTSQSQNSQLLQNAPSPGINVPNPLATANMYDNRSASMTSASGSTTGVGGQQISNIGRSGQSAITSPLAINVDLPPAIGTPEKPVTPTIIRPADIYRRLQEEREKERLSQESSRPSLSGLARDESPAGKSDASSRQTQNVAAPVLSSPPPLSAYNEAARPKGPVYSPQLPEIRTMSGFGDDFGGSFLASSTSQLSKVTSADTVTADKGYSGPLETVRPAGLETDKPSDSDFQHQPSLGYKTVVNQAFNQAIPPTPSSASGSAIDRSNSDSTSNISPIISREASTSVHAQGISNISSIIEEPAGSSRPGTAGSKTNKPFGAEVSDISKPSHKRESSAPSAGNSPARTPVVETGRRLVAPQEAEVALATPTSSVLPTTPRDRSSSPSKSKVRDLVDKIDTFGNAEPERPQLGAKDSFRPSIPGAWQSYTTNLPPQSFSESETTPNIKPALDAVTDRPAENRDQQFAKAAAAGSALAGALATAAGFSGTSDTQSQPEDSETHEPASKVNTAFHPEATRLVLPRQDSGAPSSIVPTPLDMKPGLEAQSEYFASAAEPRQEVNVSSKTPVHISHMQKEPIDGATKLNAHSSPTDLESDRLHEEIVRELSPKRDQPGEEPSKVAELGQDDNDAGYSAIYDSYLDENETPLTETHSATNVPDMQTTGPAAALHEDLSVPAFSSVSGPLLDVPGGPMAFESHELKRQFSWETPLENIDTINPNVSELEAVPIIHPEHGAGSTEVDSTKAVAAPSYAEPEANPSHLERSLPPVEGLNVGGTMAEELRQPSPQIQSKASSEPVVQQPQSQIKVLAFREIMAIQSTPQRIQVYEQTRETFAKMDTGLMQWIQTTITSLPEHEDLLRNGGVFPPIVRATPAPGPPAGQGAAYTSKPAFTPSSSRTVKGKDLLHTAGVFGGKANSAAKGLFAKGRSKWGRNSDKGSKRIRNRSINANGDITSTSSNQIENTWETDVSAPYFSQTSRSHQQASNDTALNQADLPTTPQAKGAQIFVGSERSDPISPPTLAASDSPTLGRSNTTAAGSAVSPLSGRTSFERKRASLAQKRASMEIPGSAVRRRAHRKTSSVDSHRYGSRSKRNSAEKPMISTELRARLTVHQNQMRSFGEEFPADLIIPAEYRIPSEPPKTPPRITDSSAERTPTQADFPKDVFTDRALVTSPLHTMETKNNEQKAASTTLWLDVGGVSQSHTFDGPASPDYALRKEEESSKVDATADTSTPKQIDRPKHYSSFSFIQFDPMASEDLTLKNPITPKRQSFRREHSDVTEESERETPASNSSFADYPAAEDFGALPIDPSVTSQSDLSHPQSPNSQSRPYTGSREEFPVPSRSSEGAKSRSSMLEFGTKRSSKQFGDSSLDEAAVSMHESGRTVDGIRRDSANAYKRHSMLSDVRESRELYPDAQHHRKQNRKSLLGLGLGTKPQAAGSGTISSSRNPKFNLVPSGRNLSDRDGSRLEANALRPTLTKDRSNSGSQQSGMPPLMMEKGGDTFDLANTSNPHGEKGKRRRFSGLTSFINKAKPRIGLRSGLPRGTSPTPIDPVSDRRVIISQDRQEPAYSDENDGSLHNPMDRDYALRRPPTNHSNDARLTTHKDEHVLTGKAVTPSAHIRNAASIPDISSNREAIANKITAPPQTGADYKSVYPPEFYGEQPIEGYYGPDELDGPINPISAPRPTPVPSGVFESKVITQEPAGNSKDQPRRQLPPLRKDDSTHSTKTTTITLHNNRGMVKTTTETETISGQGSAQTSPDHQQRNRRITDSLLSSMDTSSLNSPTMYTATTNTVTRIDNGRSPSPGSRSAVRASLPIVAPLKIAKKSPTSADQPPNGIPDPLSGRQSANAESPGQRKHTMQLFVDTRTSSARPRPVEQIPDKPVVNVFRESSLPPPSTPPNRALPHPLTSQRSMSSSAIPTFSGQGLTEPAALPRRSVQANTITNSVKPKTLNTSEIADTLQSEPPANLRYDTVVTVPPLTIRKSPKIGTSPTPSQERTDTADRGPVKTTVDAAERRHSMISSTFNPSSRASIHSPALKDSPTLPRPTRPQSTLLTSSISSAEQHDSPIIEAKASTTLVDPMVQSDQASTKSKTSRIDPTSAPTEQAQMAERPLSAATLPTEPIEKGYDEPRIREPPRESDESEEEIVMSSTAYPGQEWRPDYGYGGWDGSD